MTPEAAYLDMIRRSRERALLGSCSAILSWDEQTYMPRGGAELRGDQVALLSGLVHERATDPVLADRLHDLEGSPLVEDPLSDSAVNIREWRRDYDRATKLPRALVEELARVTTLGQGIWAEAREKDDFPSFLPSLEQIIRLKRSEAAHHEIGREPYDALLDEYEPGARAAELESLFSGLKPRLFEVVQSIANSSHRPDEAILKQEFPVERQRIFGELMAAAIGFDFRKGRLDTTAHPFCTGIGPGDTRITTRFRPESFSDSFFGILHEVGHALYEQGLPDAAHGTPMGEAVSLGIHESQSRLWENFVGRSPSFWRYALPLAKRIFPERLADVGLDAMHAAINVVHPSLIRVEADEVTYNLHVIIRFELERALLRGDLNASDLPGAWNEAYRQMLGLRPSNDREGCLQDIHWSAGLIGYFPTYTLGNLFAAQLFARAEVELGPLSDAFALGDFSPLLGWLRSKIHVQGRRQASPDLIQAATGSPPCQEPLIDYLLQKYDRIYRVTP